MIPLKNLSPRLTFPAMTLLLIIANVLVFIYQVSLPDRAAEAFINLYGMVPARVALALAGQHHVTFEQAFLPLFTSMFLHGGILHILGNMWFLWIFGGQVEDRLGHFTYLVFYLICGLGSGIAQLAFSWGSKTPAIGASGAIAGVLGAYIVFFPSSRILTLVPLFIIWFTAQIPALVFIGLWFVVQFLSGISSVGAASMGGVAWWAHVGGFLLGVLIAQFYRARPRPAAPYVY
jgi:membrane associated rhomboid family serine protease